MAEQSTFARRMMAQKLMTDARPDPFSDSRFFAGKMRPSMADINQPTTMADARAPAATASLFAPGAGIADVMGYAPDPMQAGQMLPSFGANVRQGNYLDAGLQTLGVAGAVRQAGGAFVPPLAAVGTALKAPRAARVANAAMDAADAAKIDPNEATGAARLSRAKEQGFDVDNPVYHGTSAEKLSEFDEKKIGSATDAGFYGKGIYFASNPGEASYYGPNVGKYVVRGKFLDLENKTGDYTLGGAKKFIGWATQLDEIGALDDFTKEGLEGAKKLVKYFDGNVKFKPGQNPDGTTGVYAQIVDPTRNPQIYKGKEYPETVDLRVDARGFFAKDEAEAKERLFDSFAYQMKTSSYKDIDYFKGWNDDFYTSLSDYVRVGPVGSAELSKKARAAGYDGIKADDETVVFDPKNIRLLDAEFDPKKTDSPDLLSSRAVDQAIFA